MSRTLVGRLKGAGGTPSRPEIDLGDMTVEYMPLDNNISLFSLSFLFRHGVAEPLQ
jgi:hypothetical protein